MANEVNNPETSAQADEHVQPESMEAVLTETPEMRAPSATSAEFPLPNILDAAANGEMLVEEEEEVTPMVQMLSSDAAEWKERYLRLSAEFDNFRKRTNREKDELISLAGERVLRVLLPTVDDLARTLKASESATDLTKLQEGIALVRKNFLHALTKQGIEEIETVGKPFDSNTQEAIANVPAPTEDKKGLVLDEVERGYIYNGKVLRYAKVVVAE